MITATSNEKDLLTALIISSNKERPRNACICNWPDCAKYHLAFAEKPADEDDDPWRGELKQLKLTKTAKSTAFRFAIKRHLGTSCDTTVDISDGVRGMCNLFVSVFESLFLYEWKSLLLRINNLLWVIVLLEFEGYR
jgi:hypothetical protein